MGRYYLEIAAVFIGAGLISWLFGDGPQMLCWAGAAVAIMFVFWLCILENQAESKKRGGYWADPPQDQRPARRREPRREYDDRIQSANHGWREDHRRNGG